MDYHRTDRSVDGNALAGDLSEIFAVDMTAALLTCRTCSATEPLARGRAFGGGPGWVLRCESCQSVLARLVRSRGSVWLDLQGVSSIRMAIATP